MTTSSRVRGFPYSCPIDVRYADVDAMNHVNNAVYLTYLEVARMRLWVDRLEFRGSAREVPFILARAVIDYRLPISLNHRVQVGVGVRTMGRSSFTFAYRIEAGGRTAADAETVQVYFDYVAHRSQPIPADLRRALATLAMPGARLED